MKQLSTHERFMHRAIELALLAEQEGNLPVGAVMVLDGRIVAEGKSAVYVPTFDATRHAEMEAIRSLPEELWPSASELSLYTSLEPCLMCFGSILLHRVGQVYFGAADSYGGAGKTFSHLPPYFQQQLAETRWQGPLLPSDCDPLRQRLQAIETERKREG